MGSTFFFGCKSLEAMQLVGVCLSVRGLDPTKRVFSAVCYAVQTTGCLKALKHPVRCRRQDSTV